MVVASISGIRGVVGQDLFLSDVSRYIGSFSAAVASREFLLGRDTRRSGETLWRTACAALIARGSKVLDYGVISTPALFRESRQRDAPGVMITASHNEPEWNGIKLVVRGRGITQAELDRVLGSPPRAASGVSPGILVPLQRSSYNRDLIDMRSRRSAEGVAVALDLNGGAAIPHAPTILEGAGCRVSVLGGSQGVFSRTIDPTSDSLELLSQTVKDKGLDVGFAFDCDGDRLVLVDNAGRKRSGDFVLALVLKKLLPTLKNRSVVVSVDTTRAVDDVVSKLGGVVYRSKVGEANVISEMIKRGATLGGEGSSGGVIDTSYNYCRDSMLAALAIVRAIKKSGDRVFGEVPSYEQVRVKVPLDRKKALAVIKMLRREHPGADLLDGVKLMSERSWVLVRASETENALRVSAESSSAEEAQALANAYLKRVKKVG